MWHAILRIWNNCKCSCCEEELIIDFAMPGIQDANGVFYTEFTRGKYTGLFTKYDREALQSRTEHANALMASGTAYGQAWAKAFEAFPQPRFTREEIEAIPMSEDVRSSLSLPSTISWKDESESYRAKRADAASINLRNGLSHKHAWFKAFQDYPRTLEEAYEASPRND